METTTVDSETASWSIVSCREDGPVELYFDRAFPQKGTLLEPIRPSLVLCSIRFVDCLRLARCFACSKIDAIAFRRPWRFAPGSGDGRMPEVHLTSLQKRWNEKLDPSVCTSQSTGPSGQKPPISRKFSFKCQPLAGFSSSQSPTTRGGPVKAPPLGGAATEEWRKAGGVPRRGVTRRRWLLEEDVGGRGGRMEEVGATSP